MWRVGMSLFDAGMVRSDPASSIASAAGVFAYDDEEDEVTVEVYEEEWSEPQPGDFIMEDAGWTRMVICRCGKMMLQMMMTTDSGGGRMRMTTPTLMTMMKSMLTETFGMMTCGKMMATTNSITMKMVTMMSTCTTMTKSMSSSMSGSMRTGARGPVRRYSRQISRGT